MFDSWQAPSLWHEMQQREEETTDADAEEETGEAAEHDAGFLMAGSGASGGLFGDETAPGVWQHAAAVAARTCHPPVLRAASGVAATEANEADGKDAAEEHAALERTRRSPWTPADQVLG